MVTRQIDPMLNRIHTCLQKNPHMSELKKVTLNPLICLSVKFDLIFEFLLLFLLSAETVGTAMFVLFKL